MAIRKNLIGQRFAKLVVKKLDTTRTSGTYWLCKCDCGKTKSVLAGNLKRIQGCGCERGKTTTHGHSRRDSITTEYRTWKNILNRCYNTKGVRYEDWGGRGITVCKRWRDSFENFYVDMGPRPEGPPRYTLERKNNDRGYTPGNCIWATYKVQNNNTRRTLNNLYT